MGEDGATLIHPQDDQGQESANRPKNEDVKMKSCTLTKFEFDQENRPLEP